MNKHRDKITAIILAGGQGNRFNNQDKGLIEWQNKPLVKHVLDCLTPQAAHMVISCNRNVDRYQAFGWPCVEDDYNNYQGPLAGIKAGLSIVQTPYCLTSPCDSPILPDDLVQRLLITLQANNADLAYVFDGERKQYLLSLMKTDVKTTLDAFLMNGDRRVRGWHQQLKAIKVDFSDSKAMFLNINSPEELEAAHKT